jgi:hypothetical protein
MYGLDKTFEIASKIEQETQGNIPDPSFGNNIYTSDIEVEYSEPKHIFFNSTLNESSEVLPTLGDVHKSVKDDVDFLVSSLSQIESKRELIDSKIGMDSEIGQQKLIQILSSLYNGNTYFNRLSKLYSNLILDRKIKSLSEYINYVTTLSRKIEEVNRIGLDETNNSNFIDKCIQYAKYIYMKFPELADLSDDFLYSDDVNSLLNSVNKDSMELDLIRQYISKAYSKSNANSIDELVNSLESLKISNKQPLYHKLIKKLNNIFKRRLPKKTIFDI